MSVDTRQAVSQETATLEITGKRVIGSVIRLHPDDNVVIARTDLGLGESLEGGRYRSRSQVPAGYKIAAVDIDQGAAIRKYNVIIGFAAHDIPQGTMVYDHNMEFREFDRDYAHARDYRPTIPVLPEEQATFQGVVRGDGRVGTRNYIGLLSTVNCSATVIRKAAEWFTPERLADFPNVDGVVAFSH